VVDDRQFRRDEFDSDVRTRRPLVASLHHEAGYQRIENNRITVSYTRLVGPDRPDGFLQRYCFDTPDRGLREPSVPGHRRSLELGRSVWAIGPLPSADTLRGVA
jgi:hypothetical protein